MRESYKPGSLTLLAFGIAIILGGSNAVAVRFSNLDLPPFWGAALRFGSAAILFWAVVLVRRITVPRGRALRGVLIFGVLTIGVSYALLYWALQFIPASTTMVVGALVPIITFLLAVVHGQEFFHWRGLAGGMLAFVGILFAIGNQLGESLPVVPVLAVLLGFTATAEGTVVFKAYPRSDPMAVNAIALSIGTVLLLLISLIAGEAWKLPGTQNTWLAYGYLVLGGSVGLFYLFLYVLERWTASATSYAFLLFPVGTIIIASWLAGEEITGRFLIGTAVVLVGVWLGALANQGWKKSEEKP